MPKCNVNRRAWYKVHQIKGDRHILQYHRGAISLQYIRLRKFHAFPRTCLQNRLVTCYGAHAPSGVDQVRYQITAYAARGAHYGAGVFVCHRAEYR